MTARDEAIEAATKAILDYWQLPISSGDPHVSGDARRALDAALPVLLNDLADRIEARRDGAPYRPGDPVVIYTEGYNDAIRNVAAVVRAAAEGWNE